MSSLLKIETPLLQRDIKTIEEQISAVRSSISQMRSAEQQLEAMWEGAAKNAFRQQFESDCQEMENILKLLESYKAALLDANKEYLMSSDNVSSIIKSISV